MSKKLPFWLILALVLKSLVFPINVAEGIAVVALAALYGFMLFIDFKQSLVPKTNQEIEELKTAELKRQIELSLENMAAQRTRIAEMNAAKRKGDEFGQKIIF